MAAPYQNLQSCAVDENTFTNSGNFLVFSQEDNARGAAKWRELCTKLNICVSGSSNGLSSIWDVIDT
jgi:hypothetical protein